MENSSDFTLIVFIVVAGTLGVLMTLTIAFLLFVLYIQRVYYEPAVRIYLAQHKSVEEIEKEIDNDSS